MFGLCFVVRVVILIFFYKYWQQVIAIAPRTEPLETPIDVRVEDRTDYYGHHYKTKVIVDRPTDDVVG